MSDRWPAEMSIGGNIPRSLRQELAEVVADTGAGPEYGDAYNDANDVLQEIRAGCPHGGGLLQVQDGQAYYGGFHNLEEFCVKHGIHFDMHCDAYAEYDAQNTFYRGGEYVVQTLATQDGREVIETTALRKILEEANTERPFDDSYVLLKLQEAIDSPDPLKAIRWVNHRQPAAI